MARNLRLLEVQAQLLQTKTALRIALNERNALLATLRLIAQESTSVHTRELALRVLMEYGA